MALIDMSETYQMTNVGDHIDGTDVYQSNPNLLDNAYFVGGGSQLGDGIFPINQRGQTSYSSVGYGIDRWRGETGYASVALATDGLKFCSSTSGQWGTLVQLVASAKYLAGETVTISAIIDGTLIYTTYTLPSSGSYDLTAVNVNGIYINLYSPDGVNIQFRIYTQETTQHTIKAAKLEKGTVSTLANDPPPDFGEELRKCQRYLRDVSLKRTPCYFDGTYSVAVLTLTGIEMANSPTPSLITAGFAWQPAASASANLTAASLITFEQYTPTIQFVLSVALSGMGMIYDTVIRLSCEL